MASEISATERFPFDGVTDQATESRYRILTTRCWGRDSGVLSRGNTLAVTGDSTGMQVKVASGEMWLDGNYARFDTNPMTLTGFSSAGVGSGQRLIYRVVAQVDWVNNTHKLVVKAGSIATIASAVPPALTQVENGVWEQSLAQVWIGTGDATVTAAMVIDERTFARSPTGAQPGDYKYVAYSGTVAGWLPCDGRAISRVTHAELFAFIGSAYGAGDGSTTFNIPDKRGEVFAAFDDLGTGDAGRLDGSYISASGHYGEQTHALTTAEMPVHDHPMPHTHTGAIGTTDDIYQSGINQTAATGTTQPTGQPSTPNTSNAGSGAGHNNVQPTGMAWLWVAARPV